MLIMTVFSAFLLSFLGNCWMDKMYREYPSILSYPESTVRRGKIRRHLFLPLLAVLFLVTLRQHPDISESKFIILMLFEFFLLLYTFTDFEQQVIFDKMLLPFAALGLLDALLFSPDLADHILAAAAGGGFFLFLAVVTRGGIGGGDIKLIAALGLWLGASALKTIAIAGILLGGLAALLLLLSGHKKKNEYFAYCPYFTIAAILAAIC